MLTCIFFYWREMIYSNCLVLVITVTEGKLGMQKYASGRITTGGVINMLTIILKRRTICLRWTK